MYEVAPDVNFIPCCNNSYMAASNADIIVTAISGQAPVLKASDITKVVYTYMWEDRKMNMA